MGLIFLLILSLGTLIGVMYLLYQVSILRGQIDSLETKLLRLRLSKNKHIRHAEEIGE